MQLEVVAAREMKMPSNAYKMDTDPRGLVCVINYKNFANEPSMTRNGSEHDVTNLENLFTQMGYKVNCQSDLTEDETKAYLRSVRTSQDLKRVSCLVMFIMSHGIARQTFYTSDMRLMTTEWVTKLFYNKECPNLKGKPKLFFFNFCRGDYEEERPQPDGDEHLESNKIPKIQTESSGKKEPPRDIWCAYSTTDGFVTYRCRDFGSPFLVAWILTLSQHACGNDLGKLEVLFKEMCRKVPHTTVPEIQKFSFSEFYFNPKQRNL